jgi:hypothetical protein
MCCCSAGEKAIMDELGVVTGMRIFDALFVENLQNWEDAPRVQDTLQRAANETVESLFPQVGDPLFEPTPLAYSCEPLVATISLGEFFERETGFQMDRIESHLSDFVEKGDDVTYWTGFCHRMAKQLVKDRFDKMYYREDPEVFFFFLRSGDAVLTSVLLYARKRVSGTRCSRRTLLRVCQRRCAATPWSSRLTTLDCR